MGGTQRIAKFVKFLPEFGWTPHVVTVKEVAYYAEDRSLLEDVKGARVRRTGSLDPARVLERLRGRRKLAETKHLLPSQRGLLSRLAAWLFVPDAKVLWQPFALAAARRVIKTEGVDCLLTTGPPHSTHLTGGLLKRLTGLPWVADFRDGWAGGNFQSEPTRLHGFLNQALERRVVRQADRIVAVSPGLAQRLQHRHRLPASRVRVVTNGFDPDDFPASPKAAGPRFTLAYCGTVSAIAPLDSLLSALASLLASRPELRDKMTLRIVGLDLTGALVSKARALGLAELVQVAGYVEHRAAVRELAAADLLLYPVAEWASADFIPGKTFEYLASGKPVLAIGPRVEGVELLQQFASASVFSHGQVEEIAEAIWRFYSAFQTQPRSADADLARLSAFDRRTLTASLAELLDEIS